VVHGSVGEEFEESRFHTQTSSKDGSETDSRSDLLSGERGERAGELRV